MKRAVRFAHLALGLALVASLAILSGCSSKSSNPSAPNNGGTGSLNLSLPPGGGSATQTFATAGNVPYKCAVHPGIMFGDSVIVTASAAQESVVVTVVGVSTPGFTPSTVSIKPGGSVRWINPTGMTHGVINQ